MKNDNNDTNKTIKKIEEKISGLKSRLSKERARHNQNKIKILELHSHLLEERLLKQMRIRSWYFHLWI